ncbi:MAG: DUF1592 domain-containing protein [Bryobacteraceae bacterium]|nr:DUF1592 domain-containing protein [Bryobacteraceae bacterium]
MSALGRGDTLGISIAGMKFLFTFCFPALFAIPAAAETYTFKEAQALVKKHCLACHHGKSAAGDFNVTKYATPESIEQQPRAWSKMLARVRDGEMPPKGAPAPAMEQREQFVGWLDRTLKTAACADGISPAPFPLRRLNRSEYAATMRDLLNIHINAGAALPADGAGGEGFDNAAETLFLSPIHAEKYLEAAKHALEYGAKDPRARVKFIIAEPGPDVTAEQAARTILEAFLPRAFRRPASGEEVERYLALFGAAQRRGDPFDDAILYALSGVLVSPHFLFRLEAPGATPEPQLAGDYEMASRLSYFLWGSMPDEMLFELAAQGKLRDAAVVDEQVERMLKDVRAREFAESFVEQWLGTRELGRDIKPDPSLFPDYYDAEMQGAIRYEPILFFQELLADNLSLLNLLHSSFTVLNNKLEKHYALDLPERMRQQPRRAELPEGSPRGGLLGMAAVLAVSSYPHRTSPVLRGKWVMEAILGTPPPPPPPDVPELKEEHEGETPRTLRERLTEHRKNPVCASCHDRIDPLGFALENYNVLGQWRWEEAGKPIDAAGELPGGVRFDGPDQLKTALLDRKDDFVRNLAAKMLGYALGRGLTLEDYCTVEQIAEALAKDDYRAQTLIREVARSVPFRYKPGTVPAMAVAGYDLRKQEGAR